MTHNASTRKPNKSAPGGGIGITFLESIPGLVEPLARGLALAFPLLLGCASTEQPGAGTPAGAGGAIGSPGAGGSAGVGGTVAVGGTAGGGGTSGAAPTDPVVPFKAIHRLSNVEYDNTVSHLLGTQSEFGEGFVYEEAEGFDNIATALSMSPRQVENYFAAARTLSADVFADPTLRGQVVACDPAADAGCAETVINGFGRRAWRRPLEASESAGLLAKYQEAISIGLDEMGALQHVVHIILSSPQFLYRIEFDPDIADPTPHDVSAYELASRLSYALWSSMPDDELFALAESGELLQADRAALEVDRMLQDPKSEMLVSNFAAQWFGSRRLEHHVASSTTYPSWTPALGASMQREMELFFSAFLFSELPYTDFLTQDMNFVDAELAAHYGMAAPAVPFEQVVDPADQRVGFLGLAGFLTHTSREHRSSPIIRGKWILDAVWCQALKLPTNIVVEPLPEPLPGDAPTTVREQMANHRVSPACSGCHDLIDPIGLSLEGFDGIGRYRDVYENGLAIDTVGTLPNGAMVDSLTSLSTVLAQDPQFVGCAAQKFGTYAMGVPMAEANRDQVVAQWVTQNPTLRNLLKETVRHVMFRMRRAE